MNHIHFNFYCYNVVFLYTYITFFFCSTQLVSHAFKNDGGLSRRHAGYNSLPTASWGLCVRQVSTIGSMRTN